MQLAVPGLYALSGVAAYAAASHLAFSRDRAVQATHALFAGLCILAAAYCLSLAWSFRADGTREYVVALRCNLAATMLFFALFPWYIAAFSRVHHTSILIGLSTLFVALFAINLVQPFSLQYAILPTREQLHLPWDEAISHSSGPTSRWFALASVGVMLALAHGFYSLSRLYRTGRKDIASAMMLALGILAATATEGILVRLSVIDFIHLGALGFLSMVVVMKLVLTYEMRQRGQRLEAIVDHLPSIVEMKDLTGRFLLVNQKFADVLHVDREAVLGKTDHTLTSQAQAQLAQVTDQQAIAARQSIAFEETRDENGQAHTYHTVKFPLLHRDGTPYAVCGVSTDITERKRAELKILAAETAAAEASNAKTQFLHSMSHELRTPLNGILGFAQLLRADSALTSPTHQESVAHIISESNTLLRLINDVLALSRIGNGKAELNSQDIEIAKLTSTCVEHISTIFTGKSNVSITNDVADPHLIARGDRLATWQVLINLLSNAVKYNREKGHVTVIAKSEGRARLRIEVHDTGTGIPQEKLPLLFEPFERIDQRHGTISGVGIGLHIAKQLVERMHGQIGVQSTAGQGSVFWFTLPLADASNRSSYSIRSVANVSMVAQHDSPP